MAFDTERGYDKLVVNGATYDGRSGPEGVIPNGVISWTSDSSVTRSGWKICATSAVTTTRPVPGKLIWSLASGLCTVEADGCAASPNYPAEYNNNQACVLTV